MKRLWWICLVLISGDAFALKKKFCEFRLAPPIERVVRKLDFTALGDRHLFPTTREDLALLAQEGFSVIPDERGRALGLIFDTRPGRRDRGFWLRGDVVDDVFHVRNIRVSAYEKHFFRRIAQIRGVAPVHVSLDREFLNCSSLVVEGWAQIKLAMKHRLTVRDVADLLGRARASAVWDSVVASGRSRYVIDDFDRRGRPFRVVIEEAECPHGLITAFERMDPN